MDNGTLLQNDRSQADLIAKLANVGTQSPGLMHQMHTMYDGSQQSLNTTPKMELFNKFQSGVLSIPSQFDMLLKGAQDLAVTARHNTAC